MLLSSRSPLRKQVAVTRSKTRLSSVERTLVLLQPRPSRLAGRDRIGGRRHQPMPWRMRSISTALETALGLSLMPGSGPLMRSMLLLAVVADDKANRHARGRRRLQNALEARKERSSIPTNPLDAGAWLAASSGPVALALPPTR